MPGRSSWMRTSAIGILLAGCVTSGTMQNEVRKRAVFDLDCPADKVSVVEIESPSSLKTGKQGTWGARGCGRQATYVQVGGSENILMNSAVVEKN